MSYELRYHPQVKRSDLPKLDGAAKARIRTAIETRLAEKPEHYSEPLRKTLQPYRKLRVGDYRVIFRVNDNTVFILAVLTRNASTFGGLARLFLPEKLHRPVDDGC